MNETICTPELLTLSPFGTPGTIRSQTSVAFGVSLAAGTAAPLGSHPAEIYAKFAADHDHADEDFSTVIEMIRNA